MATEAYMLGRKKYQRPQAMLWSENSGTLVDGLYIPNGLELNSDPGSETDPDILNQFLILSDDNRAPIDFKPTRIENRKRMVNGRMRSYHIADKLTISTSWDMLPSRSYYLRPDYSQETGKSAYANNRNLEYTTDGGAGGVDLLKWYENHKGSFWVFLAYDKYSVFGEDDEAYANLPKYNQLIEMFIADFSYTVVKRGGTTHDFWNISVTLEEV
jgi:hypothetical protein